MAPSSALLFATDGYATRTISDFRGVRAEELNSADQALCGAIAGFTACFVMAPTDLVKCQLQVQIGQEKPLFVGTSGCVRTLLAEAGVCNGLYRGFCATALRDTPSYALYFSVYKQMKTLWNSVLGVESCDVSGGAGSPRMFSRETAATLMAGGLAGMACWASIYPIDVVKSVVQSLPPNAPLQERRMLTVAVSMYRRGGVRLFVNGFTATMCRAFPVNAVTFAGYEAALSAMDSVGFVVGT